MSISSFVEFGRFLEGEPYGFPFSSMIWHISCRNQVLANEMTDELPAREKGHELSGKWNGTRIRALMFFQNGEILMQVSGVPRVGELRGLFARLAASREQGA